MAGFLCQVQKERDVATVTKKKLRPFRNYFTAEHEIELVEHSLFAEKVI
jgi:hypothetical protein